jgi:hypothetical protein
MGARVYDPDTGTFLQTDPILHGGAGAYGYTDGDPVDETDLAGTEATCAEWSASDGKAAGRRCERLNTANLEKVGRDVSLGSVASTVARVSIVVGVIAGCTAASGGLADAACVAGIVAAGAEAGTLNKINTLLGRSTSNSASAFGAATACLDVENVRLAVGCGAALYGAVNAAGSTSNGHR